MNNILRKSLHFIFIFACYLAVSVSFANNVSQRYTNFIDQVINVIKEESNKDLKSFYESYLEFFSYWHSDPLVVSPRRFESELTRTGIRHGTVLEIMSAVIIFKSVIDPMEDIAKSELEQVVANRIAYRLNQIKKQQTDTMDVINDFEEKVDSIGRVEVEKSFDLTFTKNSPLAYDFETKRVFSENNHVIQLLNSAPLSFKEYKWNFVGKEPVLPPIYQGFELWNPKNSKKSYIVVESSGFQWMIYSRSTMKLKQEDFTYVKKITVPLEFYTKKLTHVNDLNGELIVATNAGEVVRLDLNTSKIISRINICKELDVNYCDKINSKITAMGFTNDHKHILLGTVEGKIFVTDEKGHIVKRYQLTNPSSQIMALTASNDLEFFAASAKIEIHPELYYNPDIELGTIAVISDEVTSQTAIRLWTKSGRLIETIERDKNLTVMATLLRVEPVFGSLKLFLNKSDHLISIYPDGISQWHIGREK